MGIENIQKEFNNLWSHHNDNNIKIVMRRLEELKMQGQYYNEINMPEISNIIKGLSNDISILKREKTLLLEELSKKSKPGRKKKEENL